MTEAYIALDLETTGLRPEEDRILEIGAARIENGEIRDTLELMVNPGIPVPPRITALTGITQEMADLGVPTAEAMERLTAFIGDLPLLGHNIPFDYSFVRHTADRLGRTVEAECIDTLRIARACLGCLERRNLGECCRHYGIRQDKSHRALDDALAAHHLYEKLAEEFGETSAELFLPQHLACPIKKRPPITAAQKGYLQDLLKYHKIDLGRPIGELSKNEASRIIDGIILQYGRISR